MATLTWMNAGVQELCDRLTHKSVNADLLLRLYTNNHAPAVSDGSGAFTICTLGGYADVTLVGATWTDVVAAGICTATYPTQTFTFTPYAGGVTIYGVLYTTATGTPIVGGLLDAAFPVPAGGASLTITPQLQTKQCT